MESNSGKRDQWGSKFGFIMAAAGSAIGLGNVWRFPYITGKYGGGALVVISMILTFIAGLIPSGFAARRDPVEALRTE